MRAAVAQGVFPGGCLQVQTAAAVQFTGYYGVRDLSDRLPVDETTVFDLASLTKPLATAPAVWLLAQTGDVVLDAPLENYLPGLLCGNATLRELLCHTSGLPAYLPFHETLRQMPVENRTAALRQLLKETVPEAPPGTRTCYSDLGYMCLSWLVETVAGAPFQTYVQRCLYHPCQADGLHFPGIGSHRGAAAYAATEACPWRGYVLRGEVHDDTAYAAGGYQGHAGLFGRLADLGRLIQVMTQAFQGRQTGWPLSRETMQQFWKKDPVSGRTPGMDTPSGDRPSSGRYFGPATVGHLGFTGTSFWVDPAADLSVILLTNRVHPSRDATAIRDFRPKIHDAVMQAAAGTVR